MPRWAGLVAALLASFSFAVGSAGAEGREIYVAFLGDGGTGGKEQKSVARQLELAREQGKLDYVFLLGDNLYPKGEAKKIGPNFLDVYRNLLDAGVAFHAALGNHDVEVCGILNLTPLPRDATAYTRCEVDRQLDPANRFGYANGSRYYHLTIPGDSSYGEAALAQVFVIDTNTLASSQSLLPSGDDRDQLQWLDGELSRSTATWKIVIMHHPIHTPKAAGWFRGHSRELRLGEQLEPILMRGGVDVVFAGHNHFYARIVPQAGIRYFVSGGGGQRILRYRPAEDYVAFDPERGKFHHFIHVRVSPEWFEYCVVDAVGRTRDGGRFRHGDDFDEPLPEGACPY
ncbi:MAG TPA: metallophosphoesterase [Vicinamibacteria bacterium]|nr:metallophosphoesterase [Vicinamibacteria bacterium]